MLKPFIEDINSKIKTRTKEQWISYLNERIAAGRAYIQDNGEVGFILAFVLGIFVVVFFKLAFAIFFIAALLAAMVWCIAESDIERKEIAKKTPDELKIPVDIANDEKDINTTIQ